MPVQLVTGNILDVEGVLLVHICNTTTKTSKGLAKDIFTKYPWANTYDSGVKRNVGNITYHFAEADADVVIVNLYGQNKPGKPNKTETAANRLEWFKSGLSQIREVFLGTTIAVPYKIGCGLAGGNWDDYLAALEEHSRLSGGDVIVHKLE